MVKGPDDVKQVHTSNRSNAQSWYFQGAKDARLRLGGKGGDFIQNEDGSYSVTQNSDVYIAIKTNDQSGQLGLNQSINSSRGYMLNARDWTSVEAHGYFFVDSAYENSEIPFSIGFHGADPESRIINKCLGVGYQAQLFTSGKTRFAKSLWYPSGFLYQDYKSVLTSIVNRWIGFKATCIRVKQGVVKMQILVDEGNVLNNWQTKDTVTDSGGWGGQGLSSSAIQVIGNACGGTTDQVIDNGGPIVSFKWSGLGSGSTGVKFKKLAVREVNPSVSYNDSIIKEPSRWGSRKPKYGEQEGPDTRLSGGSGAFATVDRD